MIPSTSFTTQIAGILSPTPTPAAGGAAPFGLLLAGTGLASIASDAVPCGTVPLPRPIDLARQSDAVSGTDLPVVPEEPAAVPVVPWRAPYHLGPSTPVVDARIAPQTIDPGSDWQADANEASPPSDDHGETDTPVLTMAAFAMPLIVTANPMPAEKAAAAPRPATFDMTGVATVPTRMSAPSALLPTTVTDQMVGVEPVIASDTGPTADETAPASSALANAVEKALRGPLAAPAGAEPPGSGTLPQRRPALVRKDAAAIIVPTPAALSSSPSLETRQNVMAISMPPPDAVVMATTLPRAEQPTRTVAPDVDNVANTALTSTVVVVAPRVMPAADARVTISQGPAVQVFGAAIAAARRDERSPGDARDIDPSTLHSATEMIRTAVAPTADAQQAPLDLRQERWPHAMIDRIEHLRDTAAAVSAAAADTNIRLVPDSLGTIDISIAREGDSVSVHFRAEHAATRTLLQDSQDRLADIAESRGLRLSGSSVDGGSANAGQQHQPARHQQPVIPGAPPRASTRDTVTADDAAPARVA